LQPREVIGGQLRYFRRRRDWTQEDLVQRFEELDIPGWRQSKIAKIERGEAKRLPVDDLLELALALGCPPVMLLAPDPGGLRDYDAAKDAIEIAPGHVMLAQDAREWIRGRRPIVPNNDSASEEAATFYFESQPLADWIIDEDALRLSQLLQEMVAARQAVLKEQFAQLKAEGRVRSEPAEWNSDEEES
jgi:transcriptional regulator with XRE-family HTH domain